MTTPALSRAALDRAAHHRKDEQWLAHARENGRLLLVDADRRAIADEDGLVFGAAAGHAGDVFFLGVDDDGTAYFSAAADELPRKLGARPVSLRDVGAVLSDRDAGLLVATVALANWHQTHPRCPRCGSATEMVQGGWVRQCVADGSEHFPRTDPAVIVVVHDGADRCLLGRQPSWPAGRYSTLAGFVEPGESLEQAVVREIEEESGAIVDDVTYRGSQPWPFPASLMLGFEARAVGGDVGVGDDELEDVRWFSRDDLRNGRSILPPPASIAHWLITTWLARGR